MWYFDRFPLWGIHYEHDTPPSDTPSDTPSEEESAEHAPPNPSASDADLLAAVQADLAQHVTRLSELSEALRELQEQFRAHLENHVTAEHSHEHSHEQAPELMILIDAVRAEQGEERAPERSNWFTRKVW